MWSTESAFWVSVRWWVPEGRWATEQSSDDKGWIFRGRIWCEYNNARTLIDAKPNVANAVPWTTHFLANRQGCSYQIFGRYGVSSIIPSWDLPEFNKTCSNACANYGDLAKSTGADVEEALRRTDSPDLKASFRRALSIAIPPPTVYCNFCSDGDSELIFGIPLVDLTTDEDNIPKVMKMCIEEVEKRGLNTRKIYAVSWPRRVLEFTFSVAGWICVRWRSTGGRWNPLLQPNLLADVNLHSVTAQVRKWKDVLVQFYRQHIFRCDSSQGQPFQLSSSIGSLGPTSSAISGTFPSHFLCSL